MFQSGFFQTVVRPLGQQGLRSFSLKPLRMHYTLMASIIRYVREMCTTHTDYVREMCTVNTYYVAILCTGHSQCNLTR